LSPSPPVIAPSAYDSPRLVHRWFEVDQHQAAAVICFSSGDFREGEGCAR
jgi:hypothetical protein